jgi:hypothetical protein
MLRMQRTGIPVCVTVSHLDGLVVARSAARSNMPGKNCSCRKSTPGITQTIMLRRRS